jgi:hypothetical protein
MQVEIIQTARWMIFAVERSQYSILKKEKLSHLELLICWANNWDSSPLAIMSWSNSSSWLSRGFLRYRVNSICNFIKVKKKSWSPKNFAKFKEDMDTHFFKNQKWIESLIHVGVTSHVESFHALLITRGLVSKGSWFYLFLEFTISKNYFRKLQISGTRNSGTWRLNQKLAKQVNFQTLSLEAAAAVGVLIFNESESECFRLISEALMCPIGSESLKRLKKKDIKTQLDRKKSLSSKQAAKVSRKKNLKIFQSAKKEDTYESSKDVGKRLTSELKKKKKRKQDDDEEEEESTSLAKKRKLNWKFKNKFKFEKKNICEKMKNEKF